jgi:hypothetical protein
VTGEPLPARASRAWRVAFRVLYQILRLADPLIRSALALGVPGLDGIVRVTVPGRHTGRPRRTLLTLLSVDGAWYLGHPNGPTAWTLNADAAGWLTIDPPTLTGPRVALTRLPPGPERDTVIRATWSQQPFPGNVIYRAARRHVAAVGVYYRLIPG